MTGKCYSQRYQKPPLPNSIQEMVSHSSGIPDIFESDDKSENSDGESEDDVEEGDY